MKKRILTLLCAAVMFFLLIPMPASAVVSELGREGNWIVGVDDRYPSDYIIIGYTGSATSVTIPTKVGAWVIRGVHQFAFQDNTKVRTINVPDGVTVYSLGGCQVETVNFSKNAGVASGAFKNCSKLKTVVLPESMDVLPAKLFENCTSLAAVTIPEGVEIIGEAAFSGCTALTELTLPDAVKEIKSRAFLNCTNLKSVNIPANVAIIGAEEPFGGCRNLSEIKVDEANPVFYNDVEGNLCTDEIVYDVDHVLLVRSVTGNYGDSYTIPSHITGLDRACFTGVGGLKKLVIPTTVTYVDGYIMQDCPDLTEVWLEGRPARLNYGAFHEAVLTVYYPGDTGQWDGEDFSFYNGELTWIPYCSGIHKGEAGTLIEESTCTTPGYAESVCELCGEDFILELPLKEHTYDGGTVTREPTCSAYGEITYACTACGDSYTDIMYKLDHQYNEGEYLVTPTCTQGGELLQECLVCGEQRITYPSQLGHDYSTMKQTWDETGKFHAICCSRCGLQQTEEACTFESDVITQATLDGHGVKKYTCTVCGGSYESAYAFRIYGDDRCSTAYAVADEMKAALGIEKFDAILIASGDNFADALAGSCLAAEKNAPILLYRKKSISDNVEYIQQNLKSGGTVYILGGPAAVPQEMEDALDGFKVKRLSGDSRFDTNLAILNEAGVTGGEILVATGWEFADCLSASAVGKPVLLVNSKLDKLTQSQLSYLSRLSNAKFTIIGGENAVSGKLEQALSAYGGVDRLSGETREETSVMVAERYFGDPDRIVLAYSRNFPDGLCGGPLAKVLGAPLLLTNALQEAAAADYVAAHGIEKGVVLGGPVALAENTVARVFDLN